MLLLCIILSSFSSILAEERCPAECRCESRNRVYCNNRGFRAIPNGIPIDTKVLHLQDNSLENTLELDDALGQLVNLERVMLYNNRLTHVPKLQSNALRELRLNSNRFVINPWTWSHMCDQPKRYCLSILIANSWTTATQIVT